MKLSDSGAFLFKYTCSKTVVCVAFGYYLLKLYTSFGSIVYIIYFFLPHF